MSRVTELEKALTTLFRKGTEVGYTETEIDEFLENIDYHALLQAVWNNSNIPLPIAVLQQFLGLFSMRSTRLKIVFMFMPDILKYTPFRFFESHTYHGRKKGAAPIGAAP